MNKIVQILLVGGVVLSMAACSTASGVITQQVSSDSSPVGSVDSSENDPASAAANADVIAEDTTANPVVIDEDDGDYEWDAADEIMVSLADNAINSESSDVTVDGSVVTIDAPGTYRLSGSLVNGQIIVHSEEGGLVRLILDGVDIHNDTGAAVYIENAEKVVVYLAPGSENYLSDGDSYQLPDSESDEPNATLFSKSNLTFDGTGSLMVTANYNDAIASKDGLIVNAGNLTLISVDDGLRGKDYVVIRSAAITIEAGGDGIKSDETGDASKGWIIIESGTLNIQAEMDAIDAETAVTVGGGSLTLVAGSGTTANYGSDVSMKGIKAAALITINGGIFNIQSADDALHTNDSIVINAGDFTIASGDDGIHADTDLTIEDGTITITESYEGLESATMTINGGQISITSSDDGINLAGGADGSGMPGAMGGGPGGRNGGPGMDFFGGSGDYNLYINGGTIYVNAGGDGLDSNGSITITGGTIVVNGPTNDGNGAIDYMGSFNMSGGTLLAAGSSGMAQAPDGNSSQPSLLIYFGTTLSAGTPVSVLNSAGENVVTLVPSKEYSSLVVSSPDLVMGESYTINVGGDAGSMDALGLATDGPASGGTEYATLTLSAVVTQVGTGGMGGGRR